MPLFDKVVSIFRKKGDTSNQFASQISTSSTDMEPVSDFGGSRTTIPRFVQGGGGAFGALPKKTQRDLGLDDRQLANSSIEDLTDKLMDAHPDVSFAIWNFLRIGNTKYTIKVNKVGSGKDRKSVV